jgi:MFS family permease
VSPGPARRDARVTALVVSAHFLSHFFQLSLAPLFPLLKAEFGVGYAALGLVVTVFYTASGLSQTPAGFLVDRLGPRRVLLTGLSLLAGSIGLAGLAPTYWALLPLAALAGLGNSVFHPADYAIMTASVGEGRLGRAYAFHAVGGNLGWAAAPVVVLPLAATWGWRAALVSVGLVGVAAAGLLARQAALRGERGHARDATPAAAGRVAVFSSPGILACFAYFILLSFALVGVQTFMASALVVIYGASLSVATGALTAFLLANGAGILAGGRVADWTSRHDVVAIAGLSAGATLMLATASGLLVLPAAISVLALAGFSVGATSPSRDLLVRAATPRGASGRVFGFVYSGLDVGSSTGPLMFGWLLDHGEPRGIFLSIAVVLALCAVTVVQVRARRVAPATA